MKKIRERYVILYEKSKRQGPIKKFFNKVINLKNKLIELHR